MEHNKITYLFIAILTHGVIVSCQNMTQPPDNPDLTTSSRPDVTSSSDMKTTTTEKNLESSTTPSSTEIMALQSSSPVAMTTSSTNAAVDVKVESTTSAPETKHNVTHTTHPTDHKEPHENITHSPHDIQVTHHTMGTPNEPDVDAATGDEEQTGGGEIVSIIVVLGLLGGMIAFVIFMIIKDRARTGGASLKDRKLPVIGDDHGFKPLKEVPEEKAKEKEPKLTHVEKRNSHRYSYHGNPEDAIPLLELHIQDGRPPMLNSNDETQEAQPEQPAVKPLLDVYGDGNTTMSSGKSKEKIWPEVV